MSLILKYKIGIEEKHIELSTIHKQKPNTYWLSNLFDYSIIPDDIDELIKLFYYTGYVEDFNKLYQNNLKIETKIFLLNNSYLRRDDEIIKKYLPELTVQQINTKKCESDYNILERLCSHGSICEPNNKSYSTKTKYKEEDNDLLSILEFVCKTKPELITDICYRLCRFNNNIKSITILNQYYINEPNSNICFICNSSSEQNRLISGICKCSNKLHYHCAQDFIQKISNTCKVCNTEFIKNTEISTPDKNPLIFFPSIGMFPIPLFTNKYQFVQDVYYKLKLSIIYLQFENIAYILRDQTKDQLNQLKYKLINDLTGNLSNEFGMLENNKFKLLYNTISNAPFKFNVLAYKTTENIVNLYLFDSPFN
jgi:hypothetical protein